MRRCGGQHKPRSEDALGADRSGGDSGGGNGCATWHRGRGDSNGSWGGGE